MENTRKPKGPKTSHIERRVGRSPASHNGTRAHGRVALSAATRPEVCVKVSRLPGIFENAHVVPSPRPRRRTLVPTSSRVRSVTTPRRPPRPRRVCGETNARVVVGRRARAAIAESVFPFPHGLCTVQGERLIFGQNAFVTAARRRVTPHLTVQVVRAREYTSLPSLARANTSLPSSHARHCRRRTRILAGAQSSRFPRRRHVPRIQTDATDAKHARRAPSSSSSFPTVFVASLPTCPAAESFPTMLSK